MYYSNVMNGGFLDNIYLRNVSYFLQMIAIDSIFSAINFMKTYLNPNLNDQQIVVKSNALYNGSLTDRYIYYFLIYFMYNTVCTFFWTSDINILYYGGILTIFPFIINKLFDSEYFKIIRAQKELLIKLAIAKILSIIIKFYSNIYLKKKIKNFKYTELTYLLSDYKESLGYFYDVIRNFTIILILSYVKKYSTKHYYDIIKYIYGYKTGELLDSFREDGAKDYLIEIIEKKQWHKFKNMNTYNAMLRVYQMSVSEIDIFNIISDEINFMLVKIFSIWTLASLFHSIYFVPLLSIFLVLYHKYIKNDNDQAKLRDIVVIIATVPLCTIHDGYFFISFMCQCLPKIVFNKLTFKLSKGGYKYLNNKITSIDIYDKTIFIPSISFVGYMIILKVFKLYSILMLLNILLNVVINNGENKRREILYGIIICTTYLSNFCVTHVLFNTFIIFFINYVTENNLEGIFSNINIHQWKEHIASEIQYYISKLPLCKNIAINIIGFVLRKNMIEYDLINQLCTDTHKRKTINTITEDYLLQDISNKKDKQNIQKKEIHTYNVIENFY